MQKIVDDTAVMIVMTQARRDASQMASNHWGLNVRLRRKEIEEIAAERAENAWRTIQRGIREIHSQWTGHKPQFLKTYTLTFLTSYGEIHPKAYQVYAFPAFTPKKRSSKAERNYLRRQQKAA